MKRLILALALSTVLLTQTACPAKQSDVVFWGQEISADAHDLIPILQSAGINTGHALQFADYSSKLFAAIKANDGTAVGYAESAITVLRDVAADVQVIHDPVKRTLALALLGLADRYLHKLADQLGPAAIASTSKIPPAQRSRAASVLAAYSTHEVWRCRNSITGRFEKLEFCKANPSTTTVEVR